MSKHRVLILCQANICRSPMAAGYLNKLISDYAIEGADVDSAGLQAMKDNKVPEPGKVVSLRHGFSVNEHRARQVTAEDLSEADDVLVMERTQLATLEWLDAKQGGGRRKVFLLGEFSPLDEDEIDDPYGGSVEDYEAIFATIKAAVDGYFFQRLLPAIEKAGEQK